MTSEPAPDVTLRFTGNPDRLVAERDLRAQAADLAIRITRLGLSFQGGLGGRLTQAMLWIAEPGDADRLAEHLADLPCVMSATAVDPGLPIDDTETDSDSVRRRPAFNPGESGPFRQ